MTYLLDRHPWIVAVLAAGMLVYFLWRLLKIWFWPYMRCKRCSGTGKRRAPFSRAWRTCPRCGGNARRIRLGRQALARLGVGPPPK